MTSDGESKVSRVVTDAASPRGFAVAVTDHEFELFRALVARHTGIALAPNKRILLAARLGRRLRALEIPTFADYYAYLTERDAGGEELVQFINAMTTHTTNFFRETHHFEYLAQQWVPSLSARAARTGHRRVRIWSAGCSTGEEPYSIAMVVMDALGSALGWDVRILASDIATGVLATATAGVYTMDQVAPVPRRLLERWFLRGRGANGYLVQARPELRALIAFRRINLKDETWPIRAAFDVICCRNVLIYFDRAQQRRILEHLLHYLKNGGFLMLGHAENIHGLLDGVTHLGRTIYRKGAEPR